MESWGKKRRQGRQDNDEIDFDTTTEVEQTAEVKLRLCIFAYPRAWFLRRGHGFFHLNIRQVGAGGRLIGASETGCEDISEQRSQLSCHFVTMGNLGKFAGRGLEPPGQPTTHQM